MTDDRFTTYLVIDTDETIDPHLERVPAGYAGLRSLIDSCLDVIHIDRIDVDCWIDDEGKFDGAERNHRAEVVLRHYGAIYDDDWLAGRAVFSGGADDEGETRSITHTQVETIAVRLARPDLPRLTEAGTRTAARKALEAHYPGVAIIDLPGPPPPDENPET